MSNPKNYRAEVKYEAEDCVDAPTVVIVDIDKAAAEEIAKLMNLVKANDLWSAEKFDFCDAKFYQFDPEVEPEAAAFCGAGNEVVIEGMTITISGDDTFHFAGLIEHTSINAFSDRLSIPDLLDHFGLSTSASNHA